MKARSRRRFLARVAAGGGGLAFPALAAAQGTLVLRWQSAWPAKHPFHAYALDLARRVNDMTGGDLHVEMAPLDAAPPASGLLDAVSSGKLDGAHGTMADHYASDPAFALWGSGPAFGMDANMLLAWHRYGGGRELLARLYASLGADVVSFLYGPRPAQPLGWFRRRIRRPADFKGLRFRSDAVSAELFRHLGASVESLPEIDTAGALRESRLDGAELEGPAVDRALGMAGAAGVCMLGSFHQSAEQFEVLLNKPKFEALPAKLQAILGNAIDAASADLSWKMLQRDSAAYSDLRAGSEVAFHRTPDAVLARQLAAYDAAGAAPRNGTLFAEIERSQRAFASRALRWRLEGEVDRRFAYRHYFVPRAKR